MYSMARHLDKVRQNTCTAFCRSFINANYVKKLMLNSNEIIIFFLFHRLHLLVTLEVNELRRRKTFYSIWKMRFIRLVEVTLDFFRGSFFYKNSTLTTIVEFIHSHSGYVFHRNDIPSIDLKLKLI